MEHLEPGRLYLASAAAAPAAASVGAVDSLFELVARQLVALLKHCLSNFG